MPPHAPPTAPPTDAQVQSQIVNFLWAIAELLRDAFKKSENQNVILPFTVLRRLDYALEPAKKKVLELNAKLIANRLYDILTDLGETGMYTAQHVTDFCRIAFSKLTNEKKIGQLHGLTNPIVAHYQAQAEEDRRDFKSKLRDFVKLYSFLSQIITFQDPKLEQFFAFSDFLVKKLPPEQGELPYDILSKVDLDLFKPQQVGTAPIPLQRGDAKIEPPNYGGGAMVSPEDIEPLSKIIVELNEQFGTRFTDEDRVVIKRLEDQLTRDKILEQQLQVGSKDAVRLSFEQVAQDMLHALIDSNFKFYKKVQDDQDIARELFDRLFERYYARKAKRP
jgi:type I restriction enzyme R subunit